MRLASGLDKRSRVCCAADKLQHLEVEADGCRGQRDDGAGITPYQPASALHWNDVLLQIQAAPIGSSFHDVARTCAGRALRTHGKRGTMGNGVYSFGLRKRRRAV